MSEELVNPLVRLICERLPWLFSEYRFKVVDYSYDARAFGNCLVILDSETLLLRFVRDRGLTTVELAARANPDVWYGLGSLLKMLHGEPPDAAFEGTAVLLKENWPALTKALGPKLIETKREQERLREEGLRTLREFQRQLPLTPRGRFNMFKKTAIGKIIFLTMRVLEVSVVLWALYIVVDRAIP